MDEEAFLLLIRADPDLCKQKYAFDAFEDDLLYPLHMICALGATAGAVKACHKAFPDAIHHTSESQMGGPLHYACSFGADVEVVVYLAKKDPGALLQTNEEGKTPLHLASQSSAMVRFVYTIVGVIV